MPQRSPPPSSFSVLLLVRCIRLAFVSACSALSTQHVRWLPSTVELRDVSQSYPDTPWRRLTSSVPRREFALDRVSASFSSTFRLVTGASSSGKSTILRLVAGVESPVGGEVVISCGTARRVPTAPAQDESSSSNSNSSNNSNNSNNSSSSSSIITTHTAKPVCLNESPSVSSRQSLDAIIRHSVPRKRFDSIEDREAVIADILSTVGLPMSLMGSTTFDLSPSQNYLFRLAEASLHSMVGDNNDDEDKSYDPDSLLPAPVLLVDEWMDRETRTVARTVQAAMERIAGRGGVVLCVTHKPEYFDTSSGTLEPILMNRGTILNM